MEGPEEAEMGIDEVDVRMWTCQCTWHVVLLGYKRRTEVTSIEVLVRCTLVNLETKA
jgi:hypothetical protein